MTPGIDREKAELLHMLEVLEARAMARVPGKEIFHYSYTRALAPDPAFPLNPDPDSIWIQGLDDQKLKEKYRRKIFLIKNCNLLMYRYVQATGKSFSPQQGTPSTSNNEIYQPFPMFGGHFCSHRS
jgi:hypothetical protein